MKSKNNYPKRKSPRAKWHDYNGAEYFVTICTKNKLHYFGEIKNNEIALTEIGLYLKSQIENIQKHYPFVEILIYTIMPNHIHLIIAVDGSKAPCRDKKKNNTTTADGTMTDTTNNANSCDNNKNEYMRQISNKQGWLSACIGSLKSAVTKYANEKKIPFAWQERFHDHIIRNKNDMNRIAKYIENNPIKWASNHH